MSTVRRLDVAALALLRTPDPSEGAALRKLPPYRPAVGKRRKPGRKGLDALRGDGGPEMRRILRASNNRSAPAVTGEIVDQHGSLLWQPSPEASVLIDELPSLAERQRIQERFLLQVADASVRFFDQLDVDYFRHLADVYAEIATGPRVPMDVRLAAVRAWLRVLVRAVKLGHLLSVKRRDPNGRLQLHLYNGLMAFLAEFRNERAARMGAALRELTGRCPRGKPGWKQRLATASMAMQMLFDMLEVADSAVRAVAREASSPIDPTDPATRAAQLKLHDLLQRHRVRGRPRIEEQLLRETREIIDGDETAEEVDTGGDQASGCADQEGESGGPDRQPVLRRHRGQEHPDQASVRTGQDPGQVAAQEKDLTGQGPAEAVA